MRSRSSPRSNGEEAVPTTSLKRNSAVPSHVVAQGIIANGPLLCMGAVMTSAAIYAQGAMPLAYLLGAVLVWLWVNTPLQYSKRLASSGGMFYFVTEGSNVSVGFAAGVSYALYYTAFAAAGAVYFSVMVQALLGQLGLPSGPGWLWVALPVPILAVPALIVHKGVRPSLRYGLVTGVAELVIMVVASVAIVVLSGARNTARVFEPSLAHHGFAGVGVGMLLAAFSMSGSTATVYLGHEAHLPHKSIRRGLVLSTSAVVVVFLLVSYAMTIGWGPTKMGSFAASAIPGLAIIGHFLGTGVELGVALLMANSIVSAIVASMLVVTRVSHAMAHAGVAPGAFRRVQGSNGSPFAAVLACFAAASVAAVAVGAIWGPATAFTVLILVGTMGEFVGHIIGNAVLPFFARRRRMFKPLVHVALPVASLVTTLVGVYYTVVPIVFRTVWGPILFLGGLFASLVALAYRRRHSAPGAAGFPSSSGGGAAIGIEIGGGAGAG